MSIAMPPPSPSEAALSSSIQIAEASPVAQRLQDGAPLQDDRIENQVPPLLGPWDRTNSPRREFVSDTGIDPDMVNPRMRAAQLGEGSLEFQAGPVPTLRRQAPSFLGNSLTETRYDWETPIPRAAARPPPFRVPPAPRHTPSLSNQRSRMPPRQVWSAPNSASSASNVHRHAVRRAQTPVFRAPNFAANGDWTQRQTTVRERIPRSSHGNAHPFDPHHMRPPPPSPMIDPSPGSAASSIAASFQEVSSSISLIPFVIEPQSPAADTLASPLASPAPTPNRLRIDIAACQIIVGDTLIFRDTLLAVPKAYYITTVLQRSISELVTTGEPSDRVVMLGGEDASGGAWYYNMRMQEMVVVERPTEDWLQWLRIWTVSAQIQLGSRTR